MIFILMIMCLLNHQWNIADNGNEEIIKDSFPWIENVEKKSHKNTTRLVWMGFSRCPILSVSHPPLAGHYSALDPVYVVFTFSLWWMVVLVCVWRTLKLTFYDPHLAQRLSPPLLSVHLAVLFCTTHYPHYQFMCFRYPTIPFDSSHSSTGVCVCIWLA